MLVKEYCDLKTSLGEGIFLSSGILYWLDINEKKLLVKEPNQEGRDYNLPEHASAIQKVVGSKGYLVCESGLCVFDRQKKEWTVDSYFDKCDINSQFRANDGGWIEDLYIFGIMQKHPTSPVGSIFKVDNNKIIKLFEGIAIPNTFLKYSNDEILISDSFLKRIYRFKVSKCRTSLLVVDVWLDFNLENFTPDGGCIDKTGNFFIAMWDGACIHKYDRNKKLLQKIDLPAKRPTNCCLSEDESVLYVSTALEGLSVEEVRMFPLSGSILEVTL